MGRKLFPKVSDRERGAQPALLRQEALPFNGLIDAARANRSFAGHSAIAAQQQLVAFQAGNFRDVEMFFNTMICNDLIRIALRKAHLSS
jgi:hypothetical protein